MRPAIAFVLVLSTLLAGCADDGPATSRLTGPLDRALTADEQDEVRRVAGEFTVQSTLIGCPPEVDPYDCNEHWLGVEGLTAARCKDAVERLEGRTYWRRPPTCDVPPGAGR